MLFASLDAHTPVDYVIFPSVALSKVAVTVNDKTHKSPQIWRTRLSFMYTYHCWAAFPQLIILEDISCTAIIQSVLCHPFVSSIPSLGRYTCYSCVTTKFYLKPLIKVIFKSRPPSPRPGISCQMQPCLRSGVFVVKWRWSGYPGIMDRSIFHTKRCRTA